MNRWIRASICLMVTVGLLVIASSARADSNKKAQSPSGNPSGVAKSQGSMPFPLFPSTSRVKGNNGVGNGIDPQPPGNPPINDGRGTAPGFPGNRGGAKVKGKK